VSGKSATDISSTAVAERGRSKRNVSKYKMRAVKADNAIFINNEQK
jgi:hypothetical protein